LDANAPNPPDERVENGQFWNLPQIRPSSSGNAQLFGGLFGASLELSTPSLITGLGFPRLFLHGDGTAAFMQPKKASKEGAVEPLTSPEVERDTQSFAVDDVLGQGTEVEAEIQTWLVSAGGGIAFTFDLLGVRWRIKPSVEYLREEVKMTGVTQRAVALVGRDKNHNILIRDDALQSPESAPGRSSFVPEPGFYKFSRGVRPISLTSSKTRAYHGVGPGLEIETDVERFGPFMVSMFASGKATAFIGDLGIGTNAVNELGESAAWNFEKDRWAYRALVGMRLSWLPE
jgi:hypothetical protein